MFYFFGQLCENYRENGRYLYQNTPLTSDKYVKINEEEEGNT